MNTQEASRIYADVRSVRRASQLLKTLSRMGRATPGVLAKATGIDRATVYRLLATLCSEQLVSQEHDSDAYMLAVGVREIADGYRAEDRIARIVAFEMGQLLSTIQWPSDFAVFEDGAMVIRETTHQFSAFSVHRTTMGRARPLFTSALGLAVLAFASDNERKAMCAMARERMKRETPGSVTPEPSASLLAKIRADGYATAVSHDAGLPLGAIAVPAPIGEAKLAALNVVFYHNALRMAEAIHRFAPPLISAVERTAEAERTLRNKPVGMS